MYFRPVQLSRRALRTAAAGLTLLASCGNARTEIQQPIGKYGDASSSRWFSRTRDAVRPEDSTTTCELQIEGASASVTVRYLGLTSTKTIHLVGRWGGGTELRFNAPKDSDDPNVVCSRQKLNAHVAGAVLGVDCEHKPQEHWSGPEIEIDGWRCSSEAHTERQYYFDDWLLGPWPGTEQLVGETCAYPDTDMVYPHVGLRMISDPLRPPASPTP